MKNHTGTHIITEVRRQKKRAHRRSIFLDGEYAFGVSDDAYVKFALFVGREMSDAFIEEVLVWEQNHQAKQAALRLVNRRLRSRREVRSNLAGKGFEETAIQTAVAFLEEYDLLDDEAFARAWVHDQLLRRPVGRIKLEQGLHAKGVDRDLIVRVLDERFDEETELDQALRAAGKRLPGIRHDDAGKRERTLRNFLAGRGFSWRVISRTLATLRRDSDGV